MQKGLSLITHNGITVAELYGSKVAIIDMNTKTACFDSHGWTTRSTTKAMNAALIKAGLYGSIHQEKGRFVLDLFGQRWPDVDKNCISLTAVLEKSS